MPVSLQTVALSNGDTAPHAMNELYGVTFTDGTSAPSSGAISLSHFNGKTIGGTQTFSYNLTNVMGTSNQGGTWRGYTFTNWTLPTGFSSTSSNFSMKVDITNSNLSGGYFASGTHYGTAHMYNVNNTSATVTHDTSAGWWFNPYPSGVSGSSYSAWSSTKTAVNNSSHQLSAGDTVALHLSQYVEYWPTLNITFTITW